MKFIIAVAALVATNVANAKTLSNGARNSSCDTSAPHTKVVNRCSYPVYLWSVDKQLGCDSDDAVKLNTGEFYHENYQPGTEGGISIKLSKFDTCGGKDITQLEYKIEQGEYAGNYLDMSFVDCTGNLEDCPGRTDGFYLKSGNEGGIHTSGVNNEHCPVFNVHDAEQAAKVSYVKWDDRQTKFCDPEANLQLYLCGGEAPDAEDDTPYAAPQPASSAAPSSSQVESPPSPASKSRKPEHKSAAAPSSTEEAFIVAAAAVTEAPSPAAAAIKTEVVYVTEYVNKRHAHGRRHQHFHA